ncbi:hypothetical protein VOLCADRAFT_119886 [Volvox carteri f. nagariensis]|uniref:Box C/D snoRNA protein 1 n=1 Tax=Volvox carteri f. nagariensis TaxID=3068 RepID=D8UHN9_VOLCA|nr:uncharacterized protein VOLCADRAFT_119886 [Volvox carteri f. nagariensis]EFJ40802.1 hypothetical protein VOLCADRAFT_119886 [Volvox carteri f. nagariensis]|eukprot:XP_002958177.1 hypothetical protein VOLCADRAFT_119886 [Volvox carteri f. nagariensis]
MDAMALGSKSDSSSEPASKTKGKGEAGVDAEDEQQQQPRNEPPPPLCEQCGAAPSKYRCPGCQRRSCSLECVRAHKAASGCSGQRDRTAFVSMQDFDDGALLSDFRLLEEIGRADDVARRCRPPAPKPQLPPPLASLVYQASWRSVKLLLMSPGMAKRRANTTRYDARNRTMWWRVEWRFPAVGIECVDERVDEHSVIGEVLSAHLRHPAPHYIPLRAYAKAGLAQLRVFMRKEKTPANQPAYFPIDTSKPLSSQISSRTIIEYPVFIVALPHEGAEAYPPPPMLAPPSQPPPPPPGRRMQPQQPAQQQAPVRQQQQQQLEAQPRQQQQQQAPGAASTERNGASGSGPIVAVHSSRQSAPSPSANGPAATGRSTAAAAAAAPPPSRVAGSAGAGAVQHGPPATVAAVVAAGATPRTTGTSVQPHTLTRQVVSGHAAIPAAQVKAAAAAAATAVAAASGAGAQPAPSPPGGCLVPPSTTGSLDLGGGRASDNPLKAPAPKRQRVEPVMSGEAGGAASDGANGAVGATAVALGFGASSTIVGGVGSGGVGPGKRFRSGTSSPPAAAAAAVSSLSVLAAGGREEVAHDENEIELGDTDGGDMDGELAAAAAAAATTAVGSHWDCGWRGDGAGLRGKTGGGGTGDWGGRGVPGGAGYGMVLGSGARVGEAGPGGGAAVARDDNEIDLDGEIEE